VEGELFRILPLLAMRKANRAGVPKAGLLPAWFATDAVVVVVKMAAATWITPPDRCRAGGMSLFAVGEHARHCFPRQSAGLW